MRFRGSARLSRFPHEVRSLFRRRVPALESLPDGPLDIEKVHVGCGTTVLDGWYNVDIQDLPGVDRVLDVTRSFPFTNLGFIFCEHFLEHLRFDDAVRFLERCAGALRAGGVLRLTTPNLDWVWATHYGPERRGGAKISGTLMLNRAFYGWGHRFLWSPEMLEEVLCAVGFADVVARQYGESPHPELRGVEHHERYGGSAELPDLLVYEAVKASTVSGGAAAERLQGLLELAEQELLRHLEWRLDR